MTDDQQSTEVVATRPSSRHTYRMGGQEVPMVTDRHCHVCRSPLRFEAEDMIVVGTTFKAINERLAPEGGNFSADSLRRHWRNHMPLAHSVTGSIIQARAQRVGKRIEDSDQAVIDGITLLETVVQKSFERMARGEEEPTIRDGLNAAKALADLGEYDSAQMDQQAYVEAFTIYQDEARRLMGEEAFEQFGQNLASSPALAELMQRYYATQEEQQQRQQGAGES